MEKLIATAAVLFAFGLVYNSAVAWLQADGVTEGYMAFVVAGGVAAVVLGAAIVYGVDVAIGLTVLFLAAGTPMIFGSVQRYARQLKEAQARMRDEV